MVQEILPTKTNHNVVVVVKRPIPVGSTNIKKFQNDTSCVKKEKIKSFHEFVFAS